MEGVRSHSYPFTGYKLFLVNNFEMFNKINRMNVRDREEAFGEVYCRTRESLRPYCRSQAHTKKRIYV